MDWRGPPKSPLSHRAQPRYDQLRNWVIYLGPEGGDKGGEIVVAGTPGEVAECPTSHTGRYLKQVLAQHPPEELRWVSEGGLVDWGGRERKSSSKLVTPSYAFAKSHIRKPYS